MTQQEFEKAPPTGKDAPQPIPSTAWRTITRARTDPAAADTVAVLLGYYNGSRFLAEQVESIARQTHQPLEVFIADDASSTPVDDEQLRRTANNRLSIHLARAQENRGFVRNFLEGLAAVSSCFDYFAFSDQDDIWHPDKLERAVAFLRDCPPDTPTLYCARTAIIDATCTKDRGHSPLFERPPSFANALLQNIAGGNTMVFNRAARDLIAQSSSGQTLIWHDWWCYQIVAGAGGIVHYDSRPCLSYRQHASSLIGANNGWRERMVRIQGLLNGQYQHWNRVNIAALQANRQRLTPNNQIRLDRFAAARDARLPRRLRLFRQSGAHRQRLLQNIALWVALLLHRV